MPGGQDYSNPESLLAQELAQKTRPSKNRGKHRGPSTETSRAGDDAHFDGQRAKIGAAKLLELAKAGKPFFLAVGFTKPICLSSPQKNIGTYTNGRISRCPERESPSLLPHFDFRQIRRGQLVEGRIRQVIADFLP